MRRDLQCAALAAILLFPAFSWGSALCPEGSVRGSLSSNATPDEMIQCKLIGRVFCLVEEKRDAGIAKDAAINGVAETMSRLGETGTHLVSNYRPTVSMAADYVYSHGKMLPWTRYYYAAYSCGFNQRLAGAPAPEKLSAAWERLPTIASRRTPARATAT